MGSHFHIPVNKRGEVIQILFSESLLRNMNYYMKIAGSPKMPYDALLRNINIYVNLV